MIGTRESSRARHTMYLVEDLYKQHGEKLGLEVVAGEKGMKRGIKIPEAHRPGLSLSGYLKGMQASVSSSLAESRSNMCVLTKITKKP